MLINIFFLCHSQINIILYLFFEYFKGLNIYSKYIWILYPHSLIVYLGIIIKMHHYAS